MNFGRLSNIITDIKDELSLLTGKNSNELYNKSNINSYLVNITTNIKNKYPDVTFNDIQNIFTRFFETKYVFNKEIDFSDGKKCFRDLDKKFTLDEVNTKEIKVPKKFQKLEKHFQKLFHTPQPEQRTKAWYDFRYLRVTASDTATAVDLNPYEPYENFIVKKCDPDFPFLDNIHCHHGKKYEPIATMIYEHVYNNKVTEFGCLPSEKYPILAASPDGICSKSTLDGKFSDRLGTMLEIKCPVTREIKKKGKICGEICPFYYFCQIQQQLICCDLEKCDFWQCKILEYQDRDEYIKDTKFKAKLSEGTQNTQKEINQLITKGCIIQLLPFEYEPTHSEDRHEFKAQYLYPPRLDLTIEEYDDWAITTISNWKVDNPNLAKDYYFDKIIYWNQPICHNVEIVKDEKWFMDIIYAVLIKTWEKVNYYRTHLNEITFLKKIVEKRKKFYRLNTKFSLNSEPNGRNIIENNVLFLSDIKLNDDSEDVEENCDFID